MAKSTTLLAIETSCDETGIAVLQKRGDSITVLAEALASQVDIHKATGGVVPEVAAREHTKVIRPLLKKVLKEASINPPKSPDRGRPGGGLDAVAVTVGPGLMPALSVGVTTARTLAYAWNLPVVPVHHIEGHIYSALLSPSSEGEPEGVFPALALIVSGGHTMFIEIPGHLSYNVIGSTRDDAAGEAFDKVARLLDLPYPGGPEITKLAQAGNPQAFDFPRAMKDSGDLDFSFSGLKTAVLYTLRDNPAVLAADVAASFQQAVVDSLIIKTQQALKQKKYTALLLAGGVAANPLLREQLTQLAKQANIQLNIAPLDLCGDNAVMIGQIGLFAFEQGRTISWRDADARARINLEEMSIAGRSG